MLPLSSSTNNTHSAGHCKVPKTWPPDPQLAAWVVYIRQRHKANNLSLEKVKELERIGFQWKEEESDDGKRVAGDDDEPKAKESKKEKDEQRPILFQTEEHEEVGNCTH